MKIVLTEGTRMVELFYPDAVLGRMASSEQPPLGKGLDSLEKGSHNAINQFWMEQNLQENDWLGLASNLLTEVFSLEFLTPLQDVDTVFSLKVKFLWLSAIFRTKHFSSFNQLQMLLITVNFLQHLG